MDDTTLRAVVGIARRIAAGSDGLTLDALVDRDWEQARDGLSVFVHAGRMHGTDWEATFRWNPTDMTWSEPRTFASFPEVADPEGIHRTVPQDVREEIERRFAPMRTALTIGPSDVVLLEVADFIARGGETLSLLVIELLRERVGYGPSPEEEEIPAPAFG